MTNGSAPNVGERARTDSRQEGPKLAEPVTFAAIIEELEEWGSTQFDTLTDIGREGAIQSEGEIRRGVIAMNGAGLLAVISLLSQSLHLVTVRGAAGLYLLGLLFGWAGWWKRAAASRMGLFAPATFSAVYAHLKGLPEAQKPLTTVADLDEAQKLLHRILDQLLARLKKPGNAAPFWTALSVACFLLATVALVVDFEISPRPPAAAAAAGKTSGPGGPARQPLVGLQPPR